MCRSLAQFLLSKGAGWKGAPCLAGKPDESESISALGAAAGRKAAGSKGKHPKMAGINGAALQEMNMQTRWMIPLFLGLMVAATGIGRAATSEQKPFFDFELHANGGGKDCTSLEVSTAAGDDTGFRGGEQPAVVVVIFGSGLLDVADIELGSLKLEGPARGFPIAAESPALIDHVNDDNYPDLVITFPGLRTPSCPRLSVTGHLGDGTLIGGQTLF
jgi:hypothetical protein